MESIGLHLDCKFDVSLLHEEHKEYCMYGAERFWGAFGVKGAYWVWGAWLGLGEFVAWVAGKVWRASGECLTFGAFGTSGLWEGLSSCNFRTDSLCSCSVDT